MKCVFILLFCICGFSHLNAMSLHKRNFNEGYESRRRSYVDFFAGRQREVRQVEGSGSQTITEDNTCETHCGEEGDECSCDPVCMEYGDCCGDYYACCSAADTGVCGPNECASNPCANGATCNDNTQVYTCTCASGWEGYQCQINIDDCEEEPCQNGGSCYDGVNSYNCDCADGWQGDQCEEAVSDDDE